MQRRRFLLVPLAIALGLGFLLVPRRGHWEQHSGETMGTTFRVLWWSEGRAAETDRLRARIDATLEEVNARMSTYRPDSEIRRFADAPPDVWFPVSPETEAVVREALMLAAATGGAFDPTVAPLVALWGFGPEGRRTAPPDSVSIAAARARVGWSRIETRPDPPALRKRRPDVALDLSAIAKGHAVDRLGEAIAADGAGSFLVEIGGEVVVRGQGPSGESWRVELERPDAPDTRSHDGLVLEITSGAVATSGTYRNAFDARGRRFSHVIDPSTGQPVSHRAVQVTAVAEDCQTADGRATALLVLGPDAGRRLAEAEGWAARFVLARDGGVGDTTAAATDTLPLPRPAGQEVDATERPDTRWLVVTTSAFDRLTLREGDGDSPPPDSSSGAHRGAAPR